VIVNPRAGRKFGLSTVRQVLTRLLRWSEPGRPDTVHEALTAAGVPFEVVRTRRAGHATELARAAVAEGRRLVIAAGGDGTVEEIGQALVGTDTVLGVLPLGTMMNIARTLAISREMAEAAETIGAGQVLAVDVGRVQDTYFMETAGAGIDAALFGYFNQFERGAAPFAMLRAAIRFLHGLGMPRLQITLGDRSWQVRSPMVVVANSPYVGAMYAIAPTAQVDSGFLDVMVFRRATVARVLLYLALVSGGRRRRPPQEVQTLRVPSVKIEALRRSLPIHADGRIIGTTPARFTIVPACLKVLVGPPEADAGMAGSSVAA
jgi:diacylglycerol kinase (ATP)